MFVITQFARRASAPAFTAVGRWPAASQQRARRNAMIATNALAQRRAELDEVEEFLTALGGRPAPGHPDPPAPGRARGLADRRA